MYPTADLVVSCGEEVVRRIDLSLFYLLGVVLHPLTSLQLGTKLSDISIPLQMARHYISSLLDDEWVSLAVSKSAGRELLDVISDVLQSGTAVSAGQPLGFNQVSRITSAASTFQTVLSQELPVLDTYFVSNKGIYPARELIERADMALDEGVKRTLSKEALDDFKQAGKCLAFELPTAAAFHLMRATEAVLRQWHALVKNPPMGTRLEMGPCIDELRQDKADPKTLAVLDQIRHLHRNPTMHPEAFLTMREALRLFGIVQSAISAMADHIATQTVQGAKAALSSAP